MCVCVRMCAFELCLALRIQICAVDESDRIGSAGMLLSHFFLNSFRGQRFSRERETQRERQRDRASMGSKHIEHRRAADSCMTRHDNHHHYSRSLARFFHKERKREWRGERFKFLIGSLVFSLSAKKERESENKSGDSQERLVKRWALWTKMAAGQS